MRQQSTLSAYLVLYTDFSWLYIQSSQAILSVHKYVVVKVDIEKNSSKHNKKDFEKRVLTSFRFLTLQEVFLQFVKMANKLLLLCIQATVWSAVVQLPGKVQVCQFCVIIIFINIR